MQLTYTDHRQDPSAWAQRLDIPAEAVHLYLDSEVIDLHTCSFMWSRIFPGYSVRNRHRPWLPGSFAFNQVDLPRAREAAMAGICWDIPTNPYRPRRSRPTTTIENIRRITAVIADYPDDFRLARTYGEYRSARQAGCTASLIALQGGQGIDDSIDCLDRIPDDVVHRITLVHLTESRLGAPNSQNHKFDQGLTPFGKEFVQRMQEKRILVDLAHINRKGFFDTLDVTDPSIPVAVTHTGIQAVRRIWRNIDDEQIRAVADRGGTIGIIYHPMFLAERSFFHCELERLIDHIDHVVRLVGDDHVSLGSDYDGLIALPRGLKDITEQPRIVALMLARGYSDSRIKKILGENFLRVLQQVRP